jgi:hypothetical protein
MTLIILCSIQYGASQVEGIFGGGNGEWIDEFSRIQLQRTGGLLSMRRSLEITLQNLQNGFQGIARHFDKMTNVCWGPAIVLALLQNGSTTCSRHSAGFTNTGQGIDGYVAV